MKIIKNDNELGLKIILAENNKSLIISFGGNLDLYWSFHSDDVNIDNNFIITKENYGVYRLFEQLFNDIENINIFNVEDKDEFYDDNKKLIINQSYYNELYDKKNKIITWYSDETAHEVSNILKIKKQEETFKIEFYIQQYMKGYDKDFHSLKYIPIRFRNSGSYYDPFNVVFMRMYNNLKNVDDVNDYGHQIHIEEYLYNKNKIKALVR